MTKHTALPAAALALLAAAAPAAAGPAGSWTPVTPPGTALTNVDELAVEHAEAGGLHLAWRDGTTLLHRRLEADLTTLTAPSLIASHPGGVNGEVDLEAAGPVVQAYFAGQGLDGVLATATSPDGGQTWTPPAAIGNTSPAGRHPAYTANGLAGMHAPSGRLYTIWGSPGQAMHVGQDPTEPDVALPGGSSADPGLAFDGTTGQVFAAWNRLDDGGTAVMPVDPPGAPAVIPGSAAAQLQTPVSITGRTARPGVFVAYTDGPSGFLGRPAVLRVGDAEGTVLARSKGARQTALADTASGRLWVFWHRQGRIFARRSNTAVTRWGAPLGIRPPKGTTTIHGLTADATLEPLELVTRVTRGGTVAGFHQRVRPRLGIAARVEGREVRLRVTDVGDPVAGATVAVGARTATTGPTGRATLELPAGRHRVVATSPYDGRGARRVRVRRAG